MCQYSSQVRQQVLQLYREILRTARLFRGQVDQNNRDYCQLICRSARSEIDKARNLSSSEEVMRRIITGRVALDEIQQKVCFPNFQYYC